MKQYHDLCKYVLENGKVREDRTGTGTISVFGYQNRFNLEEGFPLVTTKKVYWRGIVHELLWFLSGNTNIEYLKANKIGIWDEWADENGNLGPVYGKQWRRWEKFSHNTMIGTQQIDQIANVIKEIRKNPNSRRLIVSAWNVGDLPMMALEPCHTMFQFYVQDKKLSCQLYQRSCDVFLGLPFNIGSYALLTHMVAHVTGLGVGEFVHTFGDLHIYKNHIDQINLQLSREPKPLPKLSLNPAIKNIDDFRFSDIILENYDSHPAIKGEVSV